MSATRSMHIHTHCVMLHDFEKEERQSRLWRKNSSMESILNGGKCSSFCNLHEWSDLSFYVVAIFHIGHSFVHTRTD